MLARALPSLAPVDRGLCQELVLGVVRNQATLDWLIDRKTRGRPQQYGVRAILRLGLYQLFWLDRIPEHAAVFETVELARQFGHVPQAGFVNAVLRTYVREREATLQELAQLKIREPHLGYSHPAWLWNRWRARWGEDSGRALLEWNNRPPEVYARANTLRMDPGKLLERWRMEENVDYDFFLRDWTGENLVFRLKSYPPLSDLKTFRGGGFYVQDPSTLLAVRVLAPEPGETILDLCAAPGGKTTFIAQLMGNEGRVVALDGSPDRLRLLTENCVRLGVTCVEPAQSAFLPAEAPPLPGEADDAQVGRPGKRAGVKREPRRDSGKAAKGERPSDAAPDAKSSGPSYELQASSFDRILVDAPCSNSGVMRRRAELRWRINPRELQRLRRLQLDLLGHAAPALRPGGVLVYSTCSLEPEENAGVVQTFLEEHRGFRLESQRELLPFRDGVDGAYVAKLVRVLPSPHAGRTSKSEQRALNIERR